ncbi:MAG: PQQ-dependent sugar dehydrogenase [Pseudomonadota bacterium]
MRKSWAISFITVLTTTCGSLAQEARIFDTDKGKIEVKQMVAGLDSPWAMAMLPNGELLVTLRGGDMVIADPANAGKQRKVANVPDVWAFGQGGLLDVVLDRNFSENNKIYFTYSDPGILRSAGTALASATLVNGNKPALQNVKKLYTQKKKTRAGQHFGSRIVQDRAGNIFFTIGDRGERPRAQNTQDSAGSVLRLTSTGDIPSDNPFVGNKKGSPEIWSVGHRNPQGATLNEQTGELWTLSHGARGGDEINIARAGKNYGWPQISYGTHYSGAKIGIGTKGKGFEQPIYYWDPSIAPSGFDFYSGNAVPQWKGDLFLGALRAEMVVRLEVDGEKIVHEERLFEGEYDRVRDVRSFPDGHLWFMTGSGDGGIYRVTAAN